MASLGGSVDFSRMKQQLRQLFHHPNSVTKEDISPVMEGKSVSRGEDLSYEAWAAFRNKQKQSPGAASASRSSSKGGAGKKSKSPKGAQEKMAVEVKTGEVKTIFCPNVQPSRNGRPRFRYLLLLRTLDRLFPPLLWRTPRRMLTRRNIHFPPP